MERLSNEGRFFCSLSCVFFRLVHTLFHLIISDLMPFCARSLCFRRHRLRGLPRGEAPRLPPKRTRLAEAGARGAAVYPAARGLRKAGRSGGLIRC